MDDGLKERFAALAAAEEERNAAYAEDALSQRSGDAERRWDQARRAISMTVGDFARAYLDLAAALAQAEAENVRLRDVLRVYADAERYHIRPTPDGWTCAVLSDNGDRARNALGVKP